MYLYGYRNGLFAKTMEILIKNRYYEVTMYTKLLELVTYLFRNRYLKLDKNKLVITWIKVKRIS